MACLIEFNILCPWSLRACQKMAKKKKSQQKPSCICVPLQASRQALFGVHFLYTMQSTSWNWLATRSLTQPHWTRWSFSTSGSCSAYPFGGVKKRQQRRSADRRRCYVSSRKLKGVDVFTDIIMEYHRVPLFSGFEVLRTKIKDASIQPFLSWYLFWCLNSGYRLILNPYELMGRAKVMFILGL